MIFSAAELAYLGEQQLGRLATVQADGTPQVNPVGFSVDPETGAIDVGGFSMSRSQKYRNVAANGLVAFVVDDIPSTNPWRVRCLEIRGVAEAIADPKNGDDGEPVGGDGYEDGAIIRITPRRILSFGIDHPDQAPHEMTPHIRNV